MHNHFKSLFATIFYFIIDATVTSILIWPIWYLVFKENLTYNITFTDTIAGLFIFKLIFGNFYSIVLDIKNGYDLDDIKQKNENEEYDENNLNGTL